MKKGTILLIISCIIIVAVGIISMPYIYKVLTTEGVDLNTIDNKKEEKKEEITVDSEIVKSLVYPIMHNDTSIVDSYYKSDVITVGDFSNNDILYNSFLDIYDGYIVNDGYNISFDSNYLVSRIENIYGKNVTYNLTDFIVPNGSFSDYIGTFRYDTASKRYVYEKNESNNDTIYYDVKKIVSVRSSNDNTLTTVFDVAFVKIQNGKYILYSDANYTNEISNGEYTSMNNLEDMLNILDTKKYQYTFKNDICSYDSYCFYEGKWLNE